MPLLDGWHVSPCVSVDDPWHLSCSAFTPGNWLPPGTTSVEQRTVANCIPHWNPDSCSECNSCSFVCPHAAIRPVVATASELTAEGVPPGFETKLLRGVKHGDLANNRYRVQVRYVEQQTSTTVHEYVTYCCTHLCQ